MSDLLVGFHGCAERLRQWFRELGLLRGYSFGELLLPRNMFRWQRHRDSKKPSGFAKFLLSIVHFPSMARKVAASK